MIACRSLCAYDLMKTFGVNTMRFFESERATYHANYAALLAHEGKFVAIKGETIAGVRQTYDQVVELGYERFGPVPFLVKRIRLEEDSASLLIRTLTRRSFRRFEAASVEIYRGRTASQRRLREETSPSRSCQCLGRPLPWAWR